MRLQSVREPVQPRVFVPSEQRSAGRDTPIFLVQDFPVFLVRTNAAPAALIPTVRGTVQRIDATLPILSARTFEEQMAPTVAQDRTNAELALVFGVLALALAVVGLYAVVSYGTARRSTEIAVRIAVGAPPARIVGMVLGETAGVVVAGLVLGGWFAFAAVRFIESRLFGVAARDALALAVAAMVLFGMALIAAFIPARRAARVDPMVALHRA
jgi:putative ABC transport system permease protein